MPADFLAAPPVTILPRRRGYKSLEAEAKVLRLSGEGRSIDPEKRPIGGKGKKDGRSDIVSYKLHLFCLKFDVETRKRLADIPI